MRVTQTIRLVFTAGVIATLLVAAASCTENKSAAGVAGLTADEATEMNGQRNGFDKLDKDPPVKAETWVAAGQFSEANGALPQAQGQYTEALKLDPKNKPAIFCSARVLTKARQYPQAIDMWKRYVSVTGGDAVGLSNLGYCQDLAGQTSDAEQSFKQAISKDPNCAAAHNNYGKLLVRTGRVDDGLAQFSALLKPAEANYNVATVLDQMGKKDQAKTYYNRALQIDPNFVEAKRRLAALN